MKAHDSRLDHELTALYAANSVWPGAPGEAERVLHRTCPSLTRCWAAREPERVDAAWNRISLPYVGPAYAVAGRHVLALGLNLFQYGGWDALYELIARAKEQLCAGAKRHFTNEEYGGSIFYHRLAVYAGLLVCPDWRLVDKDVLYQGKRLADNLPWLADVYDRIAYTEAIKCSPPWQSSKPTGAMRDLCPARFLDRELGVLRPDVILKLGTGTPDGLACCRPPARRLAEGKVLGELLDADWGHVWLVTVPHPAGFGGSSLQIVLDLARLASQLEVSA